MNATAHAMFASPKTAQRAGRPEIARSTQLGYFSRVKDVAPSRKSRAFTLVEVLAALLLIAIVLPVVMQGISLATTVASSSAKRNEAASLAASKVAELVGTDAWQSGTMAGDFSPEQPNYRWNATLVAWPSDTSGKDLQQLDVTVTWTDRGSDKSVNLTTLVYDRTSTTTE